MNELAAPIGDGQGEAGEGAPAGDGGQGGEAAPAYAGFGTPEELVTAHTELVATHEGLQGQVTELESLKGRQGTELGTLRQTTANLEGQIEALKTAQAPAASDTLATIQNQYDNDEITLADFIAKRDVVMQGSFEKALDEKFTSFQDSADRRTYEEKFITDNPGYLEAFNAGHLTTDINRGMSGEHAFSRFGAKQAQTKITELEAELQTKITEAEAAGIQKGAQLEQGKLPSGKVLSGAGSGSFNSQGERVVPLSRAAQRQKGVELINKLRSSSGG